MQEKEAGTNFVLLGQSRNMVGQFKKAYLHRPIKITLQDYKSNFSHTRENSKMFNITLKYFSFLNNKPPPS